MVELLTVVPITAGGAGVVELGYIGLLTGYAGGANVNQVAAGVMLFRLATWIAIIPIGWLTVLFWRISVQAGPGHPARRPGGLRGGGQRMIPGGVLAVIGASDCERLGTGLIAQPFNTWTSVAYLLAGGLDHRPATTVGARPVGRRLRRPGGRQRPRQHRLPRRRRRVGPLAARPQPARRPGVRRRLAGGQAAARRAPSGAGRWATIAAGAVLVVMGVVLVPVPDATDAVVVVLVVVALVAFVVQRIRTRARPAWSDLPFVLVAVFAVGAFLLGRTGSPACHPDAVFQWHGVWHVATAVLAVVWACAALSLRPAGRRRGPGRARPLARRDRGGRRRRVLPRGHGPGP